MLWFLVSLCMEFAYFQLINTLSLIFFFSTPGFLKFQYSFFFDPLKKQKSHGFISGTPLNDISFFSDN